MLIDRALRNTFRSFATLFLLAALVTVTSHLVYGFIFRDVLEITELHPFVLGLNPGRRVNDVSLGDLQRSETARWIVLAIQLALLPLLVAAARRIIAVEARGGVATVPDALGHLRDREARMSFRWKGAQIATFVAGLALAAAVWYLARSAGLLAAEPLPDRFNFVALELVRGLALALAAPFLLGALVTAALEGGRESLRSSA
ncbi:MAG: hypothetical protein M3198_07440 [Actinomycetota bacterium]|nr:hypothetical protein [Actinomycetota bacterium]